MNILYIFVEIIKKSTTMKNLITTLILTLSTLIGFSQLEPPKNIDLNEVQKEFMILYKKRCDSLGHKISENKDLFVLSKCQSNYLKTLKGSEISHKQTGNQSLYSLKDRLYYFYPQYKEYEYSQGFNLSEVIGAYYDYNNLNKETNKSLANELFTGLIGSDSHREIMDDKTKVQVSFTIGLNKSNAIFVVGVLSNEGIRK
jgi:hypothetical protein